MFEDLFLHATEASFQENIRALLMFANTLVHEVAHAYKFWLGCMEEPRWNHKEKKAELGFSWERNVVGRIINPVTSTSASRGAPQLGSLCTVSTEACRTQHEHSHRIAQLKRPHHAAFSNRDRHGQMRTYPVLTVDGVRGSYLTTEGQTVRITALVQHIPCQRVVNWFQDGWRTRMNAYRRQMRKYLPLSLGGAFMLIYANNLSSACVYRPLNRSSRSMQTYCMSWRLHDIKDFPCLVSTKSLTGCYGLSLLMS